MDAQELSYQQIVEPAHDLLVDIHSTRSRTTVRVVGEIDLATVPTLTAVLQPHLAAAGRPSLLLDLRAVTYLGAAGVGALVHTADVARGHGVGMRIVDASPVVQRVLRICELADDLTVVAAGWPEPVDQRMSDLVGSPTP